MPQLLTPVLSRWELNPPAFQAPEADGRLRDVVGTLRDLAVVRPTAPAVAADCSECGARCRVEYIAGKSGDVHTYIHCRECGTAEVPAGMLDRWVIDTGSLLAAIFRGCSLAIQERVAGQLWQVGKAAWAGRSREVWFARTFRCARNANVLHVLTSRPKAIVFAPTESGATRLREATENLVIALESAVSLEAGMIRLDADYVEGRIVDAGMGAGVAPSRPPKKRGERAAKIEALEYELVKHLRDARDHAFWTKDETGAPELLPRPTQKDLGVRVGLSESDVSRCLKDKDAGELRLYWNTAADLDEIMRWRGKVRGSNGRRPACRARKGSGTTT